MKTNCHLLPDAFMVSFSVGLTGRSYSPKFLTLEELTYFPQIFNCWEKPVPKNIYTARGKKKKEKLLQITQKLVSIITMQENGVTDSL